MMIIGERLRQLREAKGLNQRDIEKRTGLMRCYTSRIENGHGIPALETLQKYANALEIPMYRLFYDGDLPPESRRRLAANFKAAWGEKGRERVELKRFVKVLSRMDDHQREALLKVALRMGDRGPKSSSARG